MILFQDVTKIYHSELNSHDIPALKDISFKIEPKEFLSIVLLLVVLEQAKQP